MHLKSFFLSTLGNKIYSKYMYFFVKNITCLFIFIFTISPNLSSFYFRNYRDAHLKKSLRIFNWLLNFSFLKKLKINDMTFDISSDLSLDDLFYLNKKLSSIKKKLSFDQRFDLLYINARIISIYAERGDVKNYKKCLEDFSDKYSQLIKNLHPNISSNNKNKFVKSLQARSLLSEAINDFSNFLKDKDIFLAFGTLLGFIREGKILDHDLDIDVGYLYKNKKQFVHFLKVLKKTNNFRILNNDTVSVYKLKNNQIQYTKIPSLITIAHHNGAHIDIFICHKLKNKIIFYAKHFCWKVSFFTTKKVTILDHIIANVPSDVNKYLSENYGDWKTPLIEYNFMRDSKNLGFTDNLSSIVSYTKSVFLNFKSIKEISKHLENKHILKNKIFNKDLFIS